MRTGLNVVSLCFSLMAIAFSVIALCGYQGAVTNSGNGVLTLVGICATLIVGISVVDFISVRTAFNDIDKRMDSLSGKIDDLSKLEESVKKLRKQSNILFHHTWGLALEDKQPFDALAEFLRTLELIVESDDVKRAKSCIINANQVADKILEEKPTLSEEDRVALTKIPTIVSDKYRETNVYIVYNEKVKDLIDKVNLIKNQK